MGTSARAVAAGAAACAVIVIAGCGSSGSMSSPSAPASGATTAPSSSALLTSMQSSVRAANSVHIAGHLSNNGIPVSVNLNMHRNGDLSGTVSQNRAPFEVLGVNGRTYIKATPAFLRAVRATASACAVVCGKWLQLTPAQAGQLTGDLSMSSLTAPLSSGQVPKLTVAGSKTIGGRTAWALRAANGSVLYVSSASPHYPVAAATGGSPSEVVTYSQWNSAPKPVAPPANEVLNLNNLK